MEFLLLLLKGIWRGPTVSWRTVRFYVMLFGGYVLEANCMKAPTPALAPPT
jgi:hypothetical protein